MSDKTEKELEALLDLEFISIERIMLVINNLLWEKWCQKIKEKNLDELFD